MRLTTVVDSQLKCDAHVVFHTTDLAAQRDALFSEAVESGFELERIHDKLLLEAATVAGCVFRYKVLIQSNALVAEHVIGQGHHGILYLLSCQDAEALGLVVDAETYVRNARQRAFMMLGLKPKVALDHDNDLTAIELVVAANAADMSLDQSKLLLGFCGSAHVISGHTRRTTTYNKETFSLVPLQLCKTSMPKTCAQHTVSARDFKRKERVRIDHVLQQIQSPANHPMLRAWTRKSMQNIQMVFFGGRSTTEMDKLTASLQQAPHRIWVAAFMLLLNIDHLMKDEVLETDNTRNSRKIVRYYIDLKQYAVNRLLSSGTTSLSEFVDICEELYVIA